MRIRLLGAMAAQRDDGSVADCGGVKQRAVLAQLALEPNRPVGIDRLAEGVWGEQVPDRYRQILQVYVSTLRKALEPGRASGTTSRIVGHGEAYELVAADDEVDVTAFGVAVAEGSAALAQDRPTAAVESFRAALDMWTGDALADLVGMPFAAPWLTSLAEQRLSAQERLIRARLAAGEHADVIPDAQALVAANGDREGSWCDLAVALVRAGRQTEALATVRQGRERLLDEHGLDPGPELRALEQRILDQDPTLLGERPPAVALQAVPVPLTRLLGRASQVDAIGALLADGPRLIVLTGPGGVGKTRLALECLGRVDGPAAWVPFADEPGDAEVEAVVALALGTVASQLDDALTEPMVLGIDNLEHVAGAGAAIAGLLARHGELRILATSRGRIGVAGEHVVAVEPLAPADAVELFAERARAVAPSFGLGSGSGPEKGLAVEEMCRRLDGLPLAIELAAARADVLDPRALLAHLPAIAAPLSAKVMWSVDLLTASQRVALAALAALEVTVAVDTAIVAVSAAQSAAGIEAADALSDVDALVRVALVRPVEARSGRRLGMLETIRSVASGLLPDPADASVGLLAVADALLAEPGGPGLEWIPDDLVRFEDDLAVLARAAQALVACGRVDDAAALLIQRRRAMANTGRQDAFEPLLAAVLAAGPGPVWAARTRVVAGSVAYMVLDGRARDLLAAADGLPDSDADLQVFGLATRAVLAADDGDLDGAVADSERALERAEASGSRPSIRLALSAASWVAVRREDPKAALAYATRSVEFCDEPIGRVSALNEVARAELLSGGAVRARALMAEALLLARRTGARKVITETSELLAASQLACGDTGDAVGSFTETLALVVGLADPGWTIQVVGSCGLCGLVLGHPDGAGMVALADAAASGLGLGDRSVPVYLDEVYAPFDPVPPRDPLLPLPDRAAIVQRAEALLAELAELSRR